MVRVGPLLVICKVLFGSPSRAERSKRERPCRSSIDSIAKVTIGHVFFSTPMRRDTRLDTDVQRISGFIRMKTVPRLHLVVNKKSQRWYPQQTSVLWKAAVVCFTKKVSWGAKLIFWGSFCVECTVVFTYYSKGLACMAWVVLMFQGEELPCIQMSYWNVARR